MASRRHPALEESVVIRHLELRHEDDEGQLRLLRVIPSDGPRAHGLSSSLYVADELWAWPSDELLEAMLTGLVKNPMARFLGIHRGEPARLSARARTLESSGRRGEAQGRRHRSIRQAIRQVSRPHSLAQTGAILTA